jgi:hypothetical protein
METDQVLNSKSNHTDMSNKSTTLAVLFCLLVNTIVVAQESNYNFTVQTLGGYTTPGVVPFWLRSNQFGSVPLDGASLSLIGAARKDYDLTDSRLFDWGASIEGRANIGQGTELSLIEAYGKVRLSIFELRAGRSKEIMGICDTLLTSGSFSVSGNNLGIPKIEVSVPEFSALPWFGELFAFKGNLAHGWMGQFKVRKDGGNEDTLLVKTFLHQKSLYGRFGKPSWKLKLYGGFNHQVMWGHEQESFSTDFTLSTLETYLYVLIGKRFNNGSIQATRPGNHVGSLDVGIEYTFPKFKLFVYRQNFYEAGGLAHLSNIQDGLNGISIEKLPDIHDNRVWEKITFELLYTKNQAWDLWLPETSNRYENYYNHYIYINGWSYRGDQLGTPFISSKKDIRDELASAPVDYYANNRLLAFNLGCQGRVKEIEYILKASWSKNFGTYVTTDEEQSPIISNPLLYGIFGVQEQFSTYLALNRYLRNHYSVGLIGAFDTGDLLYNSFGAFLTVSKSF